VISTAVPETWGYKRVIKPDNWLGIAQDYKGKFLAKKDMELLLAADGLLVVLARMLDSSADRNQFNKQIVFFRGIEKSRRDLGDSSEEVVLKSYFAFRLGEFRTLSLEIREVLFREMSEVFEKMYVDKKVKNKNAQLVRNVFLGELGKQMEESAAQNNLQSSGNMPLTQASTSAPKPNIWKVFSLAVIFNGICNMLVV